MDRDLRIALEVLGGFALPLVIYALRWTFLPEPLPAGGGDPDGSIVDLMVVASAVNVALPIYVLVCVFAERTLSALNRRHDR